MKSLRLIEVLEYRPRNLCVKGFVAFEVGIQFSHFRQILRGKRPMPKRIINNIERLHLARGGKPCLLILPDRKQPVLIGQPQQ